MRRLTYRPALLAAALPLFIHIALPTVSRGQEPTPTPVEDVVRIDTTLVQLPVTVLDRRGRFVGGLKKEEFELVVDGKPVPISHFERVVAGSQHERSVRKVGEADSGAATANGGAAYRGRTFIFFIDDLHLSLDSGNRTRRMLTRFIESELGEEDQAAIASSSGRIGFLQQLTENKDVLRAATERIRFVPAPVADYGAEPGAPMTEYMALTIERRDDPGVFDFYVQNCLSRAIRGSDPRQRRAIREQCEVQVRNRARQILLQTGAVTGATYQAFETLLRSMMRVPGGKLSFFISDGFLNDTGPRGRISSDRILDIANRARGAGMTVYTIDARGTTSGALDASGNVPFDPDGRLESASLRAIHATQDAMNALAADTGGRALRDQNYFEDFVKEALAETSEYYLLAWSPDDASGRLRKIDVKVPARPDLSIRFGRPFTAVSELAAASGPKEKKIDSARTGKAGDDLKQALADFYPAHALPIKLGLVFIDTPANGPIVTSSVEVPAAFLSYPPTGGPAKVTVAGVVLNDKGSPVSTFGTKLNIEQRSGSDDSNVIYNYPVPVKPGIYQVRVVSRDDLSGRLGTAMEWIVVPDLTNRELSLSSVLLGLETVAAGSPGSAQLQWSVDRTFRRGSRLRFMTFVYNAADPTALSMRVQVFRNGKELVVKGPNKIDKEAQSDPARLPVSTEVDLKGLAPGRYRLVVTVEERSGKTASRDSYFFVT